MYSVFDSPLTCSQMPSQQITARNFLKFAEPLKEEELSDDRTRKKGIPFFLFLCVKLFAQCQSFNFFFLWKKQTDTDIHKACCEERGEKKLQKEMTMTEERKKRKKKPLVQDLNIQNVVQYFLCSAPWTVPASNLFLSH